jgi:hypothetical protein
MANGQCAPSGGGCLRQHDCGTAERCTGTGGTCQGTCVVNADCPGGELCEKGQCTGCYTEANCQTQICNGGSPGMCSGKSLTLPLACLQSEMDGQEKALEYMLLDLTSCHTPLPAPDLPPRFKPATFSEVIAEGCPVGGIDAGSDSGTSMMQYIWRHVDWNASIPPSASISFVVQTASPADDGAAPDWSTVPSETLAFVNSTAPEPGRAFLDTGDGGVLVMAADAGDASVPPGSLLRLTVTLNPTADGLATPVLYGWQVFFDCVDSE